MNALRKVLATVLSLPATVSVALVHGYQKTLSPDHGVLRHLYPYGYCRHEPTCSTYAIQVLKERPYPIALWKIAVRILSCNPWTKVSEKKMKAMIEKI